MNFLMTTLSKSLAQRVERQAWGEITGEEWLIILLETPNIELFCNWVALSEYLKTPANLSSIRSKVIDSEPAGWFWVYLIKTLPDLDSTTWKPEDSCDWNTLDGNDWQDLLISYPRFATRCNWAKLSTHNWQEVLTAHPKLLEYRVHSISSSFKSKDPVTVKLLQELYRRTVTIIFSNTPTLSDDMRGVSFNTHADAGIFTYCHQFLGSEESYTNDIGKSDFSNNAFIENRTMLLHLERLTLNEMAFKAKFKPYEQAIIRYQILVSKQYLKLGWLSKIAFKPKVLYWPKSE